MLLARQNSLTSMSGQATAIFNRTSIGITSLAMTHTGHSPSRCQGCRATGTVRDVPRKDSALSAPDATENDVLGRSREGPASGRAREVVAHQREGPRRAHHEKGVGGACQV